MEWLGTQVQSVLNGWSSDAGQRKYVHTWLTRILTGWHIPRHHRRVELCGLSAHHMALFVEVVIPLVRAARPELRLTIHQRKFARESHRGPKSSGGDVRFVLSAKCEEQGGAKK